VAEDQIFHLHRLSSLLLQHSRKFDCAVLFFVGKWTTDGPLCMTSDCDAGVTMSVVYAKHAPMTDSSTTVSAAVTITHNASMTEVSTDTTPAATEIPTTATPAPPKDIWTVSYQNTSFKCILLSAHIILTYNNNGEVISVVMLLLLFVFCLLPVLFLLACSNDVEIVFFLTFDYRKEIVDYFSIIVFLVCYLPNFYMPLRTQCKTEMCCTQRLLLILCTIVLRSKHTREYFDKVNMW